MNKFSTILGITSNPRADIVWISQDGRRTPIPDMKDTHLQNTVAYLIRNDRPMNGKLQAMWEEMIERNLNMGHSSPERFTENFKPIGNSHWEKG